MHNLCIVFDIDDTLYLERTYVASGFHAVGQWAANWLKIPDFASHCLDLFDAGHSGDIFDTALSACNHSPTPELISALVSIYRDHQPRIEMAPDAARAIQQIRPLWPIAVISDGPVISQSRKCEALGLPGLANPIILTGIHGDRFHKPQPGSFEYVASQVEARNYVYVADNPAKDFTAPRHLGWPTVRIRRKGGLHHAKDNDIVMPDFELPDCTDLSAVLSGIVR